MAYETLEESTDQGNPVSLVLIRYGSDDVQTFRYTDHRAQITHEGLTYDPVPIRQSSFQSATSLEDADIQIDIAPSAGVVSYLKNKIAPERLEMVIRAGHVDDPDRQFPVVWSGNVTGVRAASGDSAWVTIGCEAVTSMLKRRVLTRNYQRGCPWTLYENYCNATRTVRATRTPAVVGANVVVFTSGWNGSLAVDKFIGGYLLWTPSTISGTHRRTIIKTENHAAGDALILQGDTEGMSTGTSVQIFVGCNHQPSDCRTIHRNLVNYGGQWNIPVENPVDFTNRFY